MRVKSKNEGQVLQSYISRRVAGIWFIWFLRSVSFVWFDERERQDRPAHPGDCLRIAPPLPQRWTRPT